MAESRKHSSCAGACGTRQTSSTPARNESGGCRPRARATREDAPSAARTTRQPRRATKRAHCRPASPAPTTTTSARSICHLHGAEPARSRAEVFDGRGEIVTGEVGPHGVDEVQLGVRALPQKEVAQPFL